MKNDLEQQQKFSKEKEKQNEELLKMRKGSLKSCLSFTDLKKLESGESTFKKVEIEEDDAPKTKVRIDLI